MTDTYTDGLAATRRIPSDPEPVDLTHAAALVLDARQQTAAGLDALEHLVPVVADMVTEIGALRETVTACREDLEDARAELNAARTLRVDVSSLQTVIDPVRHAPAKVRAFLAANGWRETGEIRGFTEWGRGGETVAVLPDAASREYRKRMAIYVQAIATVHGTGELGVLAGIAEAGNG